LDNGVNFDISYSIKENVFHSISQYLSNITYK
jgi:hypothetical protein